MRRSKVWGLGLLPVLCWAVATLCGQSIHSRAFGDPDHPALVFLHGGPGYNSASFESTTAHTLADAGFRVIVYDRRGEGQSEGPADYTFAQSVADLDSLYTIYGLDQAVLLGHSFGGVIATRYAESYPRRVRALVLLSAPVSIPASLRHIVTTARQRFTEAADSSGLARLRMLATVDSSSLLYSSMVLAEAMRGGAYRPARPTAQADSLRARLQADTLLSRYSSASSYPPVLGFYANEPYTTLDEGSRIKAVAERLPVFALYGTEDGLYAPTEIDQLARRLPAGHVRRIEGAAHNVFIDRQDEFIRQLLDWL